MPQGRIPRAPRSEVVDILHGEAIADPFRPLEDFDAPATRAWVDAHDAYARAVFGGVPARVECEAFFARVWDYPRTGLPQRRGELHFFLFYDGKRAQSELRLRRGLHGEARTLIDPNTLSEDGTIALVGHFVSPDGRLVAYLLSEAGSDAQVLRIRNVDTGRDLPDVLEHCRWTSVAFEPDGSSFLYNRCPAANDVPEGSWMRHTLVCRHRLGTEQTADETVVPCGADGRMTMPFRFDGTSYVGLHTTIGTSERNGISLRMGPQGNEFVTIIEPGIARFDPIGIVHEDGRDVLYAATTLEAPKGRIVALDIAGDRSPGTWRTVVSESNHTIESGRLAGDKLLVSVNTGTETRMHVHRNDGTRIGTLDIPGPCSLWCGSDEPRHTEVFIGALGYRTASAHYRYDAATGDLALVHKNPIPEDLSDALIDTVWATSKDGTRIPVTVVRLPGTEKTGDAPVVITGYGGYGISMTPIFSTMTLHWVRHGGIYVVAHLRGGGEFGQAWHDGGRLRNKQNTFDDLIACAETMIAEEWTRPGRLAIEGGSNGGLLVTACMLQRPDLFGAVVAHVPTTDMLRFHKFTAGGFWTSDYGSPDDPDDFNALRAYSPLHNVKPGAKYPPILITTGDHDDRVVPSHAYKFAATLQEIAHPANVVLLRVDRRAGHGMGKPKDKIIAELADIDAFLVSALKLDR